MAILDLSDIQTLNPDVDPAIATFYINGAIALATSLAPCLSANDLDPLKALSAKLVLAGAVLRWIDRGSGIVQTETTGPYSLTQDTTKGGLFWPSEITALQQICLGSDDINQRAGSVDMTPDYDWEEYGD